MSECIPLSEPYSQHVKEYIELSKRIYNDTEIDYQTKVRKLEDWRDGFHQVIQQREFNDSTASYTLQPNNTQQIFERKLCLGFVILQIFLSLLVVMEFATVLQLLP